MMRIDLEVHLPEQVIAKDEYDCAACGEVFAITTRKDDFGNEFCVGGIIFGGRPVCSECEYDEVEAAVERDDMDALYDIGYLDVAPVRYDRWPDLTAQQMYWEHGAPGGEL